MLYWFKQLISTGELPMNKKLSVSVCQMKVVRQKDLNLKKAEEMIKKSSQMGAELVILPEIFNSPYQADLFPYYAEPYPGPTTDFLARAARKNRVGIVGGSIPEIERDGQIYNSSFVFDEEGSLIARYRKIHLFDIDIPGKIRFKESQTLAAGNSISVVDYKSTRLGLIICYDCRFPELARAIALEGAELLVIPAAFNLTTGPAHWELIMRNRAVDNQLYVIAASPAHNTEASYQAWGHSMIIDPWGTVLQQASASEEILYAELDLSAVDRVRQHLPLLKQRRTDLYELNYKPLVEKR